MKKLFFLLALIAVKTNAQELTLQDAINLALKNSFDIQIAKNVVDANKINNNIGVAGGLPTVAATASNQESVVNINQKLNTGTEITRDGATSNNLTANVSGTMLLYNGYRVVATKKRLEILQQQSEQNKRNITVKASALDVAKEQMQEAISHLENVLGKIRAGKANPQMLDSVHVDYYGTPTPIAQVANVNTPDARTIVVQPWEKNLIAAIEKAITDANLGLNPQNDGIVIRLSIPPLTEERRKDLVKRVKAEGEAGKVAIRNIRKDVNEKIKKQQKEGVAEDDAKTAEAEVQKVTDSYIVKVDKHIEVKEKDIMTV
mgnify:CR=1 FL=1